MHQNEGSHGVYSIIIVSEIQGPCMVIFNWRHIFTLPYYDEVLAKKILSGEVPVEERDERVQKSRHILSSGLGVDYARDGDYIYGDIPEP